MRKWFLRVWAKLTGRVLVADYVDVQVVQHDAATKLTYFNPELIVTKTLNTVQSVPGAKKPSVRRQRKS